MFVSNGQHVLIQSSRGVGLYDPAIMHIKLYKIHTPLQVCVMHVIAMHACAIFMVSCGSAIRALVTTSAPLAMVARNTIYM